MTKYLSVFIAIIFSSYNAYSQKAIILGQIDHIHSTVLGENRTINIYLPENYSTTDTIKYPIIYILDGGVEEDFIHLVGIVRYYTQPWIAQFPKSIIVGIENTNRKRDSPLQFPTSTSWKKKVLRKKIFLSTENQQHTLHFWKKNYSPTWKINIMQIQIVPLLENH
jgi:enterochelin esterase-like enzyme